MRRLLVLALVLAVCPATSRLLAQGTIIQRVLVKINGEVFTQKDLEDKQVDALQAAGKGQLQGDALDKTLADMMPDILMSSVDEMLLLQRGKELGFHMTDEEFKTSIDGIKKDNKMTDADFKAALAQENMTLDLLRTRLERGYIIREVQRREIMGHMNLTEQEAHEYYDKNPSEFMKPPTVTLRELLVLVPAQSAPGQPLRFAPGVDEAAKQKVSDIRDRAVKGEDFKTLIADNSDSQTKTTGGLVGPINISEMATGIRDAIDKLQPGDITQPIRTTRGYQLFQLETRTTAEQEPFDSVRDDIAQKIGESRLDAETGKYLQQLRAEAVLDWKRDDLRQIYEKRIAEKAKS